MKRKLIFLTLMIAMIFSMISITGCKGRSGTEDSDPAAAE